MSSARTVWIDYTNHRGERAIREIMPIGIEYGLSLYHLGPMWILRAHDVEKDEPRGFAMKDIHSWSAEPPKFSPRASDADVAALVEAADIEAFIRRKYVIRADDRQREMGLSYVEAEVVDLAKEIAGFIAALSRIPGGEGRS